MMDFSRFSLWKGYKSQKTIYVIIITSFCLLLLVGYFFLYLKKTNNTSIKNENRDLNKEEVILRIQKSGLENKWTEYYKEAIARFEKTHPNVKIEYSEVAWSQQDMKLNVLLASNNSPDIIASAIALQAQRAELGQFYSLDKYIEKWEDKENVMEHVFELGLYKGKTYGIGYHWDPRVFAYRKDYFEESGLNPEKPPKNFEELKEFAIKLTKRDGDTVIRSGMDIPLTNATNYLSIFIRQYGGNLVDEQKQVPIFTEEASVRALQYLIDLYNEGVSIEFNDFNSAEKPFINGKAAMGFLTPSELKQLLDTDSNIKDKIGLIPYFDEDVKATFGGLYQLFISSKSNHKELAWEFITFMVSKEETWNRYQHVYSPIVRNDLKDRYLKDNKFNKAIYEAASGSYPLPNVPWVSAFRHYLEEAYEKSMLGKGDPYEILQQAQNDLLEELR